MEFYHLLNRGVDKRTIFLDEMDHLRFVYDLFVFNDKEDVDSNNYHFSKVSQYLDIGCPDIGKSELMYKPKKLLVNIHFFSLVRNHYHLLVSPLVENGVSLFMQKLNMGYAKYFNEKYDRSGALFQGKYKRKHITRDAHFLWIPYYIHFNPLDMYAPEWRKREVKNPKKAIEYLESYKWSSHRDYLGINDEKQSPLSFISSVTQREFFSELFGGEEKYRQSIIEQLTDFDLSCVESVTFE